MKNVLLLLLVSVLCGVAVLGCSDGKIDLKLFFEVDHEGDEPEPWAGASQEASSSSSLPLPLSSGEAPSSSSSLPASSSSKDYPDYPTMEEGAPGTKKGVATRYWDGCKQSCSRYEHAANEQNIKPFTMMRTCDITGVKEYPYFYRYANSDGKYYTGYETTPNACDDGSYQGWLLSPTYQQWISENPHIRPRGMNPRWEDAGFTCFDQSPYAVNDTLAYAFAAGAEGFCGKCFMLQFDGETPEQTPKATHKALKGKTLIIMVANRGVGKPGLTDDQHFDLLVPGGGVGNFDAFTTQLNYYGYPNLAHKDDFIGRESGGLLSNCIFDEPDRLPDTGDRSSLEDWQNCLRDKCEAVFGRLKNDPVTRPLWRGCMWQAEWFMAADNPTFFYSETPCPKYLLDKYITPASQEYPVPLPGECGTMMYPSGAIVDSNKQPNSVQCDGW